MKAVGDWRSAIGDRLLAVGCRLSAISWSRRESDLSFREPKADSRKPTAKNRQPRRGLSLLEVILAITILGLSLATMSELVWIGTRAASDARDLTKAQLLCEAKMAELAAGVVPLESVAQESFELEPDWMYSVIVEPLEQEGLLVAQVTVEQDPEAGPPATFTLTRWLIDPLLEQTQDEETILGGETTTDPAAAGTSGTSPTP